MYVINNITNSPLQNMTIILPNSNQMSMTIYFSPMQLSWIITNLTYGTFILKGLRISNNPNLLYQWKNILPFGLACYSANNIEPMQQNDFLEQNSILYILDSSEVEELTMLYQSGTA